MIKCFECGRVPKKYTIRVIGFGRRNFCEKHERAAQQHLIKLIKNPTLEKVARLRRRAVRLERKTGSPATV